MTGGTTRTRGNHIGWVAALATALVATTLSTVVQGVSWFLEVLVVLLVVAAAGWAGGRWLRHPVLVVLAQLVAVLLVVTWLYALPEALLGLLPTPDSVGRIVDLLRAGMETAQDAPAPAPATDGLRLLVVLGVAGIGVVVDVLSAGLRQPAAAGLPLLAVYCVPAALARGGLDWYWFVLAGVGFLALVASDSGNRVARWGKVLSGQGGEHAPMAATGRRVGALALVSAVVVPTLVPGLAEGLLPGIGSGRGGGPGGRITINNPMFSLRENLGAREDLTVLTYTTDQPDPEPLRIVTVDSYNGNTWGPTIGPIPREQKATGALPSPPGLSAEVEAPERTTEITIDRLAQSAYLPVPYPPVRVDVEGNWLYEAGTLNIIGDGVSTAEGLQYTVRHLDVAPDPEVLAAAPPPPADVVRRWTALPPNLPAEVAQTAREAAGVGSEFEKATALQSFFRSSGGFSYSEEAPEGSETSAIADFLKRRSGFCVHFASTMAVMARTLGIPARVAVGFLPGERQRSGSYRISLRDAHAWPELYFSGIGWMRFEPTPATRSGSLPRWAAPLPAVAPPTGSPSPTTTGAAPSNPALADDATSGSGGNGFDAAALLARVPWRVVAAAAVLLAVLASPLVTSRLVRRRRWRGARTPGEYAEAAWRTLAERLTDLGVEWPRSATPRQVEQRIGEGLSRPGAEALHRLARAVEQARYARPGQSGPVAELRPDVAAVVHAVSENRPRAFTWKARLLPQSGAVHLRSWLVQSGFAVDAWERRTAGRLGTWRRGIRARWSSS
jgi:transglutaminase-like putative cysteine protease